MALTNQRKGNTMTTTNQITTGSESSNTMSMGDFQNGLKVQAAAAARVVAPFVSVGQLRVIADACRGEEKTFFMGKLVDLAALLEAMPTTYGQDGLGDDAIVYLHYFAGGSDWYVTEKDIHGGIRQAFGYAVLNGMEDCAELGYISISELVRAGVELDLHFEPRKLGQIKAERAASSR